MIYVIDWYLSVKHDDNNMIFIYQAQIVYRNRNNWYDQ